MKEKEITPDIEREDKFIRSPVLDNQVFCLQSWCGHCGFTILANSVYDLVEEEERHSWNCAATGIHKFLRRSLASGQYVNAPTSLPNQEHSIRLHRFSSIPIP